MLGRRLAPRGFLLLTLVVGSLALMRGVLPVARQGRHQANPDLVGAARPPSVSITLAARLQTLPWGTILAFLYLILIALAELLTVMADPRWGLALHIAVLTALLVHSSLTMGHPSHKLLLALALAPLIRIFSLSMPLENLDLIYWYALVGAPLMVAAFVVARTLDLTWQDIGLTLRSLRIQALVAATGLIFGFAEYFILRPEPLIDGLSLGSVWLPALILLIGTGFNEELVFRGVMQSASSAALGKLAILYVTVVFAVLHLGYKSVVDVAFVFAVGLFFAWIVAKTRSLLGVTLSHGITNIALYLVVPFLGIAAVSAPSISVQNVQEFTLDFSQEVQHLRSLIPSPQIQPLASATATTTPTATPAAREEPVRPTPTAVYTVQPGDTLASIARTHDTTVDELLRLNDLPEPSLIQAGQTIVLPPSPAAATATTVHTVAAGETLALIAAKYQTTVETLLELNHLADPNVIPVGEPLIVPRPP